MACQQGANNKVVIDRVLPLCPAVLLPFDAQQRLQSCRSILVMFWHYGLGTCSVLETMSAAQIAKTTLIQCISSGVSLNASIIPPGKPAGLPGGPSIRPVATHTAMHATSPRLEGIGNPSKYFDLPVSSLGSIATVALKRASRAKPQHTNVVRMNMSQVLRRPIVNAKNAGATPNEICASCRNSASAHGGRQADPLDQLSCRVLDPTCYFRFSIVRLYHPSGRISHQRQA